VSSRDSAKRIVQLLAGALANAQLQTFACGHMGPVTDAALVNPALLEFLTAGA
jgi:pimeloyl-ACP methyl ester carboxylesterase